MVQDEMGNESDRSVVDSEAEEMKQAEKGMTEEQREARFAKVWGQMYDASYKLLFNPSVFPDDMLQGKMIGLYMIHELHLFDRNLKPQNIAFSHSAADSHNIILRPNRPNIDKKVTSRTEDNDVLETSFQG